LLRVPRSRRMLENLCALGALSGSICMQDRY